VPHSTHQNPPLESKSCPPLTPAQCSPSGSASGPLHLPLPLKLLGLTPHFRQMPAQSASGPGSGHCVQISTPTLLITSNLPPLLVPSLHLASCFSVRLSHWKESQENLVVSGAPAPRAAPGTWVACSKYVLDDVLVTCRLVPTTEDRRSSAAQETHQHCSPILWRRS
jgi:hypothetical protein